MFKNIILLLNIFKIKELSYLKKWQLVFKNPIFFISIFILTCIFYYPLYNELKSINFIYFSFFITIINVIMICIKKILSELFFDELNLKLSIFPIKPSEIFLAKIIHIFKLAYFIVIEFFFTALLIYGVGEKFSVFYFINSILLVITLPFFIILPLLIFILLFLYFVSNFKNINMKTLVNLIITFSSIIVVYTFNIVIYKYNEINLENCKNLVFILGGAYYLLRDIETFNIISLSKMLLFFVLEIGLAIFLLNKFYYKVLLKINLEKIKVYKSKGVYTKTSEFKTLFLVELKTIVRNQFLLINLVCVVLFTPITYIIPILINKIIFDTEFNKVVFLVICTTISISNFIAITSISRDKNTYLYEKILPIDIKNKIKSKILIAFLINFLVMCIYLIGLGIYFKFDVVNLVLLGVFFSIFCFSETLNCFRKNVKNPYLNYNSEKNLIVSNPNITKLTLNMIFIYLSIFLITIFISNLIKYIFLIIAIKSILNFIVYKVNENKMIEAIKNL